MYWSWSSGWPGWFGCGPPAGLDVLDGAGCPPEELAAAFREFRPYLGGCQFLDCAHVKEPGCGILEALAAGGIAKSRHESYVRLYQQAKEIPEWQRK